MVRSLVALLVLCCPALAGDIVGRASVVDGDSLDIHGVKIRLSAIDAPESWQRCTDARGVEYPCGRRAAEALQAIVDAARPLTCTEVDRDRYRRIVARRVTAAGLDVGREMVRSGWAIEYTRYSDGQYAGDEEHAARRKLGMWVGFFVDPSIERARRR